MLCPNSLVSAITATAIGLSEGKNTDEIALLGAVFTQLGDTLATIAAQTEFIQNKCGANTSRDKE